MEYADEPRLVFSPLSNQDYCKFYQIEMDGYVEDVPFYTSLLHEEDVVLELGCGTGRLTRLLADSCKYITGIDHSVEMLRCAEKKPQNNISYKLMDMLYLSFSFKSDVIIIPYNTINLLGRRESIEKCLELCREQLTEKGKLAIQVYHPDTATRSATEAEKLFQFAIFKDQEGGKVIKETLKHFIETSSTLNLEERYRVRPMKGGKGNRDLRHTLKLYTPEFGEWKKLLNTYGFTITQIQGDAAGKPFCADSDTALYIQARRI